MTDRRRAIIFLCHFSDFYVHTPRRGRLLLATVDGKCTANYQRSLQAAEKSAVAVASRDVVSSTPTRPRRHSLLAFLLGLLKPKRQSAHQVASQPVRRKRRAF